MLSFLACGPSSETGWGVVAQERVDVPAGGEFSWDPQAPGLDGMQIGFPSGALAGAARVSALLERDRSSGEYRLTITGNQAVLTSYFVALPTVFMASVTADHVLDHGLRFSELATDALRASESEGELPSGRVTLHADGTVVVEADAWGRLTRGDPTHEAEPPAGVGAPPGLGWGGFGGSTFTVTNTNDSGVGSLRWAIIQANSNAGPNTIGFRIDYATQRISLGSALPTVTDTLTIDGSTQPGFFGSPLIELDGTAAGIGVDGLSFASGSQSSVVQNLVINSFDGDGIDVASADFSVRGCYLGLDVAGAAARANENGVVVHGAARATIGGGYPDYRNIISGNRSAGVLLEGSDAMVESNYVGTNAAGTAAVPNADGVVFALSSSGNVVGGDSFALNVISGNSGDGVVLDGTGNSVIGNFIGKNAAGTSNLVNGGAAIQTNGSATGSTVTGNIVAP